MKTRFLILVLMTAIVLASFVSAFTVTPTSLELSKTVKSVSFDVENTGASNITVTIPEFPDIKDEKENTLVLTQPVTGNFTILPGNKKEVTVSYTSLPSKFNLGTFLESISITDTNTNQTEPITLNFVNSFCDSGVKEEATISGKTYELSLSDVEIDNNGYGQDDTEWYPLDEIEIKADVDNDGSEDVDDVTFEVCLYNRDRDRCIMDEDDMDLSDNSFNLKDGDSKTVTITFKLDPDAVDQNTDNYILFIKAYSDKSSIGEDKLCSDNSDEQEDFIITVIRDNHFVVLDNLQVSDTATCSDSIEITADVWNIGDSDEDDVTIGIFNQELGINQKIDVGDIDILEKSDLMSNFQISENAQEKSYILRFTVYDEDDDIFENEEDDKAEFIRTLKIENCVIQPTTEKSVEITAVLVSDEIKAGNDVVIKATIKNTGEETTTYTIAIEGFETFSSVKSINPSSVTLEPGKSQDILITLSLDGDAVGEQVFNIKTSFDTQEKKQAVSLSIETSGVSITGGAIGASLRENWFIWLIVLINIVLIIAIIIVAARMSKA